MRDLLLQLAGGLAIIVAGIHGVLSERRVFRRVTITPARMRPLFRMVFQIPTVAWVIGGVLLIAAPSMASAPARHWIVAALAILFVFSALANAIRTRGRHFGWMLLGAVAAMAAAGY